jgi:hypothetical protein
MHVGSSVWVRDAASNAIVPAGAYFLLSFAIIPVRHARVDMGRPVRFTSEAIERARKDLSQAQTAAHLRAAQAVLLPADHGLSVEQTAAILGRHPTWVSRTRNQYINGKSDFSEEKRGGRRHQLLSADEEVAMVKRALLMARGPRGGKTIRLTLRALLLEKLGFAPSEGALTGILTRAAPKLVAGCTPNELEDWSVNLTAFWRRHP